MSTDPADDAGPTGEHQIAGASSVVLDVTGLRCPLPVIRLAKVARDAPAGTVITVLSTDPAAEPDVAAWCRMRGQDLLQQTWLDADQPGISRILRSLVRVS